VQDVLWWDGRLLLGFVGVYAFGGPAVELAGMVDPAARRRGIGSALLDAALILVPGAPGVDAPGARPPVLLVTPRSVPAGRAFALARGAELEHSEHALALAGDPADGPRDPDVTLRAATAADLPVLARVLAAAFGGEVADVARRLAAEVGATDLGATVVVEHRGQPVGTLRLSHDAASGAVHGFAMDPAWQDRGIGRDVLRRVCRQLREQGAYQVRLEVAVDNERALGLYTGVGFTEVTTEDYYALPAGAPR